MNIHIEEHLEDDFPYQIVRGRESEKIALFKFEKHAKDWLALQELIDQVLS